MKRIMFLLLIVLFSACTESHEEEVMGEPGIDDIVGARVNQIPLTISILNQNGEDLLNPSTPNAFLFDSLKFYYLIDGEKVDSDHFYSEAKGQSSMDFSSRDNPHTLNLHTYHFGEEGLISEENGIKRGISIAFLELNYHDTDTIKTEWQMEEGYYTVMKAWYNEEILDPLNYYVITTK